MGKSQAVAGQLGPPPDTPSDPLFALVDEMPLLVVQASNLIRSAACLLGLDDAAALVAASSATLAYGDKTISVLPMTRAACGKLSLVISVQTSVPVRNSDGPHNVQSMLQHVPGTLHAYSAALGASEGGFWTVHRTLRIGPDRATELAEKLLETVRLVDFVFLEATADSH